MFNIKTEYGGTLRCGLAGLRNTMNDFEEIGTRAWVVGWWPSRWQKAVLIAAATLIGVAIGGKCF